MKEVCMETSKRADDIYKAMSTRLQTLEKSIADVLSRLSTLKLSTGLSTCRTGYEYYREDQFCYKFHSECKTWSESRKICQQEGGDLISLKDSNLNYFRSVVKLQSGPCNGAWVGATDTTSVGKWTWLNGERITYVFWYPEQPDSWGGKEHCGDMTKNYDYFMNDENCNSTLHFLCQIA